MTNVSAPTDSPAATAEFPSIRHSSLLKARQKLLGDVNLDGQLTHADTRALLRHIFLGTSLPAGKEGADVNHDQRVDLLDVGRLGGIVTRSADPKIIQGR